MESVLGDIVTSDMTVGSHKRVVRTWNKSNEHTSDVVDCVGLFGAEVYEPMGGVRGYAMIECMAFLGDGRHCVEFDVNHQRSGVASRICSLQDITHGICEEYHGSIRKMFEFYMPLTCVSRVRVTCGAQSEVGSSSYMFERASIAALIELSAMSAMIRSSVVDL